MHATAIPDAQGYECLASGSSVHRVGHGSTFHPLIVHMAGYRS